MADMEQYPQEWRQYEPIQPKGFDWRRLFQRLWAPFAAVGAFLAKFGFVLLKFKFLFSMFVSAAVYVWIGGSWCCCSCTRWDMSSRQSGRGSPFRPRCSFPSWAR